MSRLTDEEIRKMPLNEADIYLETHPDEAQLLLKCSQYQLPSRRKKQSSISATALSKVAEKPVATKEVANAGTRQTPIMP